MYKTQIENLLIKEIKKLPRNKKIGLFFSGGIDSLVLAHYLKKLNYNFTCYTAAYNKQSEDLKYAKEITKKLNLKLKYKIVKKIPKYLEKIVPLLKSTNPVQVSVALTLYIASELAKKDKMGIVLSGLGSDEIFGGYSRHKTSKNLNKDLKEGLKNVYEIDLVRDQLITKSHNLEIKAPYLEKELVDYSIKIPEKYKIRDNINKFILRDLAINEGIPKKYALRPKKAAQYGSKFDKAIERLAKKEKKFKSEYLKQFMKLGVLFSSGKDSCYATYLMSNYDISCLITIKSKNPDSYMYHTPNIHLAELQSEAMQIPIILQETTGKKEHELKDLEIALKKAKQKYKIQGVITGALFSDYQRERIEKIAEKLSLKVFNPLWHKNQEEVMREIIKNKFKIIFSSIAADGLDKSWLNKIITNEDIDKLVKLNKKNGLNIAGEGGEFESLVLDCPLFKKKLKILESEIKEENKNTAKLEIKKAKLSPKNKSF
ncbi:diphthine--ammonia ligase [Candidatus Woesearchaeota archaeon]|nr:diphthine--ammonia ligase [Candidatus Woesearchaeota archaeon]